MKLLFKYPTRGRPEWFKETLDLWLSKLSGKHDCRFLISMDLNDKTMNNEPMRRYMAMERYCYEGVQVEHRFADHKDKTDAYNRGLETVQFDILMGIADDLEPQVDGYDDVIVECMREAFPALDGAIFFHDGRGKPPGRVCTHPILGVELFKDLGWLTPPMYRAWSDKEMTKMLRRRSKLRFFNSVLFLHRWGERGYDETYRRAADFRMVDARTFAKREAKGLIN